MLKHNSLRRLIYQWFDTIEIHDRKLAQLLCKTIPTRCPFERTIKFFDHAIFHIPSLCKLNPFYEQVLGLRFKAMSYLVDECDEDIAI